MLWRCRRQEIGRCRMMPLADASAVSLHPFVTDHVEPGAKVITDSWRRVSWPRAARDGDEQRTRRLPKPKVTTPPHCCRQCIASLLWPNAGCSARTKVQWTTRTWVATSTSLCSGSIAGMRCRGMVFYRLLELAVGHAPVRYQSLVATRRPRGELPRPPQTRGKPPSLDRPPANRPWRHAGLDNSG